LKKTNGHKESMPLSLDRLSISDIPSFFAGKKPWQFSFFNQHKKLILSVTLVVGLLSLLYSLLAYTPKYTSKAILQIRDSAITSKYITSDPINTYSAPTANPVLNTMEILRGQGVPVAIWNDFLNRHPAEKQRLHLKTLPDWLKYYNDGKKIVKYKNVPGTDVVDLSFQWAGDPALAKEGMEVLLKSFQDLSRESNQSENHERFIYLSQQIEEIERKLIDLRSKIGDYKLKTKSYNVDEEIDDYIKTRSLLEQNTQAANAESKDYQQQLAAYQSTLKLSPENAVKAVAVGRNPTLVKLYDQYYTLSDQYASLRARYTDSHPQVAQALSQLQQVKANIQNEKKRLGVADNGKNVAIVDDTRGEAVKNMLDVQARSKGAQSKVAQMNHYLSQLDSKMQSLPQVEKNLTAMLDEQAYLSGSIKTLKEKALEAKIREMQTLSNVFVLDPPNFPLKANFPTRLHIILLGLLLGFAGGIALAKLKDKLLYISDPISKEYNDLVSASEKRYAEAKVR